MLKAPTNFQAVNVWLINLHQLPNLVEYLTFDEQQKYARLKQPEHQQKMINARAALRQCLSYYLDTSPQKIEFTHGQHGKPYCKNDHRLLFNLSHAGTYAVIAVNYDHHIGIDIETTKRHFSHLSDIAERVFSDQELAWLSTDPKQENIFFTLWARKEAVLKATGDGLTAAIKTISTTDKTGKIITPIPYLNDEQLILRDLSAPDHYRAAIVYAQQKELIINKN